jgi:hypothetical protein
VASYEWVPITYREFWDVPRMILIVHDRTTYLLESVFDPVTDGYSDEYVVYRMLFPRNASRQTGTGRTWRAQGFGSGRSESTVFSLTLRNVE